MRVKGNVEVSLPAEEILRLAAEVVRERAYDRHWFDPDDYADQALDQALEDLADHVARDDS